MKVILIIGKKRAGKTTLASTLIKKLARPNTYIYDINNEYTTKFGIPNSYKGPINEDEFLKEVQFKKNSMLVFEEASIYLGTHGQEKILKDIISRSRHTNNVILLIFHSIAFVPVYIFSFSDYVGLFKTNDFRASLDNKIRKNENLISIYDRVRLNSNPHYFELFENNT